MTDFEELKDLLRGPVDLIPSPTPRFMRWVFLIFGVPVWKCIIIGVTAFTASKLHYGRRCFPVSVYW